MASNILPQDITDSNTLGAALLGNVASAMLFGITSVQIYLYLSHNKDGRFLENLIVVAWIVAAFHLACITINTYDHLVTNFGNLGKDLGTTHLWSLLAHVISAGLSDTLVRGIFIYRVSRFTRLWWLTTLLCLLASVSFVFSIVFATETYTGKSAERNVIRKYSWLMYAGYSSAVAADTILSIALCVTLAQHRRRSLRQMDRVITMLMTYTINTGVLVCLCTLAVLICYATMPNNYIFEAIYYTLSGLYVNALLATLNARAHLRAKRTSNVVAIPLRAPTSVTFQGSQSTKDSAYQETSDHHEERTIHRLPCLVHEGLQTESKSV